MNYVQSLLNLTKPGDKVYVAVDATTLARYRKAEAAFQEIANVKPVYHRGGGLDQSKFFTSIGHIRHGFKKCGQQSG